MKKIAILVLLLQLVVCVTDDILGQSANKSGNTNEILDKPCDDKNLHHCSCYYTADCGANEECGSYTFCDLCDGPTKRNDGNCRSKGGMSISDIGPYVNAIRHYLLAYEHASIQGGGVPDGNMISIAKSYNLPAEDDEYVRAFAITTVSLYAGRTVCSFIPCQLGSLTLPSVEGFDAGEMGSIEQMPQEVLRVGKIVRAAITGELRTLGRNGFFEREMNKITTVAPNYGGFGRCQFPHPDKHGHVYIYDSNIDCLVEEVGGWVSSILEAVAKSERNKCPIKSYKIFPNPVHKSNQVRFEIDIPNCSRDPKELVIRDVLGNTITTRQLQEGKNTILMNGSELNGNKICRCDIVIESQVVESKTLVTLK